MTIERTFTVRYFRGDELVDETTKTYRLPQPDPRGGNFSLPELFMQDGPPGYERIEAEEIGGAKMRLAFTPAKDPEAAVQRLGSGTINWNR